jgi:hypothetical protein
MKLAQIQRRFYELVTAPEGVAKALGEGSLDDLISGDGRLDAVARLDIYANMYFYRLLEVLEEAYPRVLGAVDKDAFHNLITDYLIACPPAHPNIVEAGARLPGYLAGHSLATARPWLPALATLERTRVELFDGPDAPALALDDIRQLSPEEIAKLPLRLIPCHRLLDHETLLVWRQDVDVFHRAIEPEERPLLALAVNGTTLAELCEHAEGYVEDAAQRVFTLVGRWVSEGLLAAR